MINIAICDDEAAELIRIEHIVQDYIARHPELELSVYAFLSPEELLECREQKQFHIYLLDIIMDEKDGIEVAKAIRTSDEEAAIIYLTVSPDYAVASYTIHAFYYLLKPVEEEKLLPVLENAISDMGGSADQSVLVRTKDGIRPIRRGLIMYIEYHFHILSYHLKDGTVVDNLTIRTNFDHEVEPLLEDKKFVKISSSFLVNFNYVDKTSKKGFCMKDGKELSITRSYSEAKRRYLEFLVDEVKDRKNSAAPQTG